MKKIIPQKLSWIWYLVASFMLLVSSSALLLLLFGEVSGSAFVIDMILNLIIAILVFKKNFIGIVLVDFAVILGLISGQKSLMTLVQIIILFLTVPLWINKFSSSKK
jgi:hypothetical protein